MTHNLTRALHYANNGLYRQAFEHIIQEIAEMQARQEPEAYDTEEAKKMFLEKWNNKFGNLLPNEPNY